MQFKPLLTALVVLPLVLGAVDLRAQASGAASTGTSSNGTSETAARPGPTTARLTRGDADATGSTGRRHRRHHRHHRKMHHHKRHHAKMHHSSKTNTQATDAAGATATPR